jgi:hypothetical protein
MMRDDSAKPTSASEELFPRMNPEFPVSGFDPPADM